MALFDGLPVPQMTDPNQRAIQARSVMLQGLASGMAAGQRNRFHRDEMKFREDKLKELDLARQRQLAKGTAMMESLSKSGVNGPDAAEKFIDWSLKAENLVYPADPDTTKLYQEFAKMYSTFGKIRAQLNSTKAKVTETHFVNKFNDDLAILVDENPEAFAAISLKRPNLNSMPDMEMVGVVGQAKQSFLTRKAEEKALLESKSQPASVKLTDEIISTEDKARAADARGDTAGAQTFRDRATLLREQSNGTEVVTGYDDQGRPIVRVGKGLGAATVATQSQAQQKLLRYENTVELLNHLDYKLKPEHLGVAGVTGEWFMDRGLSQLIPEVANKERIDARSALIAAREGLLREMSNDPRFSNLDREEISKALPSSGVFESLPDAKQRLDTVRGIITERGKVYSKGLGQSAPLWTLSSEEIVNLHKEFLSSSGKKGIDEKTALDALKRFH